MTSAHASHPGLIRQNNEDCIRTDDTLGIYLLADGIGGHNAGEVASALAVDTVFAALSSGVATTKPDDLFDLMVNAIHAAHREVDARARTSLSFLGMGTTLVAVVVRESTAYSAHVGDSRAYRVHPPINPLPLREGTCFSPSPLTGEGRGGGEAAISNQTDNCDLPHPLSRQGMGNLQQITTDHTMGDQLLANGIPRDQIPEKQFHTLTQSVGSGEPPIPDFNTVELKPGDMLLLCSDGLTDMLTDDEIEAILAKRDENLEALAGNLIDAANANGGRDNVSVVLIRP
jgi:PPM family protein phosphatase